MRALRLLAPLSPRLLRPGRALLAATGLLLVVLHPASPLEAQEPRPRWSGGVGMGMGVNLAGTEQESGLVGLAAQAVVVRRTVDGPGYGLQWDGAWFDGRFAPEKRLHLSAVVETRLGDTPLRLRAGPGVGMVTVVETDFPAEGTIGDALISIGDNGAWGAVAGLSGRFRVGGARLAPLTQLLWQRAAGHSEGGSHLFTLTLGARITAGG